DPELTVALRALSRRHRATLFMTLLSAWATVLSRLSGQHDVLVGTPVAGRSRTELEPLIGFFVNTLVLRIDAGGRPSVAELISRVRRAALAAQDHQDLPFEQVVEILQPPRSTAHFPLFQVWFVWQEHSEEPALQLPGLTLRRVDAERPGAKFDLLLDMGDTGERIVGG